MKFPTLICEKCLIPMSITKIGVIVQEAPKRYRAADEWKCPICRRKIIFITKETEAFYSDDRIESYKLKSLPPYTCPYCKGTKRIDNPELGSLICPMCKKGEE